MKIGCICYFVWYFPLATYGILMKGIKGLDKSTHLYDGYQGLFQKY